MINDAVANIPFYPASLDDKVCSHQRFPIALHNGDGITGCGLNGCCVHAERNFGHGRKGAVSMSLKTQQESTTLPPVTTPELEHSKTAVLNTLASRHSRRSYQYAIDRFIAWYCSEPRLTFQPFCCRELSFIPGASLPVRGDDQPASFSDPAAGR